MKRNPIPEMPVDAIWTKEQWRAIFAEGQNILVAAAAGSGKTAVLVTRIIEKLRNEAANFNVDELLIVTFTNASAAEMKSRIEHALELELEKTPTSVHLRKQIALLNNASISTLHSFCLDLIKKYYYRIEIDPDFRLMDSIETVMLRDEVLDQLLENEYEKTNNVNFFHLVDSITNDRGDQALYDLITNLYDFSRANPKPNEWLNQIVQSYKTNQFKTIKQLTYYPLIEEGLTAGLNKALNQLEIAKRAANETRGPSPYLVILEDDINQLEQLHRAFTLSWSEMQAIWLNISFKRIPTLKNREEYDENLINLAKKAREEAKKEVNQLIDTFFKREEKKYLMDLANMEQDVSMLVQLVEKFSKQFSKAKLEKSVLDFSDLEHLALQVLSVYDNGVYCPSEIADLLNEQYKEVLIDEYQDTNMVQETILALITDKNEATGNWFMVGDVKQSIYRFRLAEPSLFMSKYKRYQLESEKTGLRIDLAKNFRSRKEVLDLTNFIFTQIMDHEVGEIDYDKTQELILGADYPDDPNHDTELLVIDMQDDSANSENELDPQRIQKDELEAKAIAERIDRLVKDKYPIYDQKEKQYRPIEYRDIAVLTRSMSNATSIEEAMKERELPFYVNSNTGYFEATEIATIISLLKIIDNPYQDIPLVSVLRSPIVGLDEEALGQIRARGKNGYYFDALKKYAKRETDSIAQKAGDFIKQLDSWRELSIRENLATLIWRIYDETSFYAFAGGLPGGKQRQANLLALHDRASQYEKTAFRGLFRFIRFVERLELRNDDLGTAKTVGEKEDVVRMMTIHSSKGLEFPVVILAGLNRKFNMRDIHSKVLLDKDYGFAANYTDIEKRITYPTIMQQAIRQKKHQEMIAEEMRVLYVALTRAKEKLILIGIVSEWEKTLQSWLKVSTQKSTLLPASERGNAKTYLDWIGKSLVRHPTFFNQIGLKNNTSINILTTDVKLQIHVHPKEKYLDEIIKSDPLKKFKTNIETYNQVPINGIYHQYVKQALSYKYTKKIATEIRSKQSVTELKRQFSLQDSWSDNRFIKNLQPIILDRPKFLQEEKLSSIEIGTAMHTVMQSVPLNKAPSIDDLKALLQELVDREMITEAEYKAIKLSQILAFFETKLGEILLNNHQQVKREVPFSYLLPAQRIHSQAAEGDNILIQGVVDCLVELEDTILLIDYKTDQIDRKFINGWLEAEKIMRARYKVQIELYSEAVSQITGKTVTKAYLYFFDGQHICEFSEISI
ncbi:helicase-exonuclease AddAB subunit AddA [Listeria sp. PSOL-1]|uniref:helicase-exonuclease AddAB subunit AddA n=1 Tax=Listeria sp. PSOL-1 TaxID=1844999 RepID=UPI0013D5E8EF|nr:helicase-exonuclease AddAB subunit AddA [Listeria sp. PSOL-1]